MIDVKMISKRLNLEESEVHEMLPYPLQDIRAYTNQYFLTKVHFHGDISANESNQIEISDASMFQVGDWIELFGSLNNTSLYSIKSIENNVITVYQNLFDEDYHGSIIKLSFAKLSAMSLLGMVSYDLGTSTTKHIQSQSLSGGFSVSYAKGSVTLSSVYPPELMGGFNSLRKMNDEGKEYLRYGYVK